MRSILALFSTLSFFAGAAIGLVGGFLVDEWLEAPVKAYACLPDDKCLLHIVPFGKPESALTCDLQSNKCWDDKP